MALLLSAGLLLAQPSGQQSMGQQSQYGSQMQQGLPATNQAQPVQVSVPFGVVNGRLVTSGDDLIFINDQQPQHSFVVRRDDIQNVKYEGSKATMTLSRPIRDSAGERSTVNFRFQNPAAASLITSWLGSSGASAQAAASQTAPYRSAQSSVQATTNGAQAQTATVTTTAPRTEVFDVKRDRFGWRSDTGRLFITPTEVIFQSLDNPGASRRWAMAAIKEVDRKNPFELKIKPHAGNEFNFKILSGNGLSTADYVALVDRVNVARMRNNQMIQTDGTSSR
jgi:hypothetical protein